MLWQREIQSRGRRRTHGLLSLEVVQISPNSQGLLDSHGNTNVDHFLKVSFYGSNSLLPPVRQALKWMHKDTFPLEH